MGSKPQQVILEMDNSVFAQVIQDFKQYLDSSVDLEEQHWSQCCLQTSLGVLRIDLERLLISCAMTTTRGDQAGDEVRIRITKKAVSFAKRIFQRLPEYLENDLKGMMYELLFDENAFIDSEVTWERQFGKIHDRAAGTVNIYWLRVLLMALGANSLEIDGVRSLLNELYSKDGLYGKKKWKSLEVIS